MKVRFPARMCIILELRSVKVATMRGTRKTALVTIIFVSLGGVLFAIFGRGGSTVGVDDRQIVMSEADIDRLAAGFSRTWHRPPAADELQAELLE